MAWRFYQGIWWNRHILRSLFSKERLYVERKLWVIGSIKVKLTFAFSSSGIIAEFAFNYLLSPKTDCIEWTYSLQDVKKKKRKVSYYMFRMKFERGKKKEKIFSFRLSRYSFSFFERDSLKSTHPKFWLKIIAIVGAISQVIRDFYKSDLKPYVGRFETSRELNSKLNCLSPQVRK